ncbi:hypothetical protein [Mycobacterium sp. 1165196.3]|uniref:hypothetical protein n=1 Tax=Mycobacterium sp. 1165196.3 TaxID=1834071 RepID=UPI0012EA3CED|nr:hypothetical protein [Mycobacterium sp. 1165196.3]
MITSAFTTMLCAAPGQVAADPGATVFPGMAIRQGDTVCMVGLVEPRLRVAVTSGQCDGGKSMVTDRDRKPIGSVILGRRQIEADAGADTSMLPVEYEVIAIAPNVTASDVLPTGRHLASAPASASIWRRPSITEPIGLRSRSVTIDFPPSPTWDSTTGTSAVRSTR